MVLNNGLIVQYFVGYVPSGYSGGLYTMPTSFSNNRYTLVQSYLCSSTFYNAISPSFNYVYSSGSQCFIGAYGLQAAFWTKVIAIGY